jgi:hypothetical protein
MILMKAHVHTFRSIVDSTPVTFEEGVTVVIGKNEQGKTNFLRAIRSFNADEGFLPGDLPNHLRPSLEGLPAAEIPITTLWFQPEPQDRKKLESVVHDINSVDEF